MDQALDFLYETKFARLKEIHTQVPRWKSAHEEWKNAQEMYTRELLNVRLAVLDREVEEEYHVENMKKWQSKANSYEEERMQENESFRSDVLQLHQEVEKWRDLKKKKKEHHDRLLAGMSFNLAMVKEDQTKVEAIKRDYEKMEHDMQQFAENMLQQLHTIKDRIRERKMTKEKYERNVAEKLNYINDSMEASKMALERKTNFVLQRKQALVEAQNSMAKKRKAMEKDLSEREETSGPNKRQQQAEKQDKTSEEEPCGICLQELTMKAADLKFLPCCHKFHEKCINSWLEIQRVCPYCKVVIEWD